MYQVAWQRLLALHTGVGLYSVAVIVAAFLAGLGAGSHVGGLWSARLDRRGALLRFALVELAVGAFGAASSWVYYDWLHAAAGRLDAPPWAALVLHFAALGPPTFLMGASLPLLTRGVVSSACEAGRSIGLLYATNMAGAGLGALATPWLLVPLLGLRGALAVAGAASAMAGLGGWILLRHVPNGTARAQDGDAAALEPAPATSGPSGSRSLRLWLALYASSGAIALSLEIVWFRVLDVAVKSSAFTFGTVLAVYLLGSAAGCLVATVLLDRVRRPLRTFLLAQCGLLAASGAGLLFLVHNMPNESFYRAYWQQYDFFALGHAEDPVHVLRLYVHLPLVLFGLPTVLMGFSFPVLQRAVHDDVRDAGRKVGLLQAANIAGCVAGSLLVGLLALEKLGTAATARLLVLAGLAFAVLGLRRCGRVFLVPLLGLAAVAAALPDGASLWRRLHGMAATNTNTNTNTDRNTDVALFDEDATGVVAVTEERADARWRFRLSVNGKGNSWLPFGGAHTALGALPAIVHPAPRRVAVVGLGSGDSAWASACREETESVTVFELSRPQPRVLRRLLAVEPLPELARFLDDPRVTVRIADGRQFLQADGGTYDVVEADAIWPAAAYSGHVYSIEFLGLVASRLRPGGLACIWAPTPRVRATFGRVFPHVLAAREGSILVGSRAPLAVAPEEWQRRLQEAARYLGRRRARLVAEYLATLVPAGPPGGLAPNEDLFPRDEFGVPQR